MNHFSNPIKTRREFIKCITALSSASYLGIGNFLLPIKYRNKIYSPPDYDYKYRTISVERVKEIKKWFEKLDGENRISRNNIFRSYIKNFEFDYKKIMPDAKSIVLLAKPQKLSSIQFIIKGKILQVLIPAGYVENEVTYDFIDDLIMKDIIKDKNKKLQNRIRLPLKTLAVRSGLAEYGRNNITYVEGYGSYHELIGYYTDKVFEDNWHPIKMMRICRGCSLCIDACPNNCITKDNFVVDIGKCITLYNELPQPMPEWISPEAHNALVGCLSCQYTCPANADGMKKIEQLAVITEKETDLILNGKNNEKLWDSVYKKLYRTPYVKDREYFSRNLKLVLNNMKNL